MYEDDTFKYTFIFGLNMNAARRSTIECKLLLDLNGHHSDDRYNERASDGRALLAMRVQHPMRTNTRHNVLRAVTA